MDAAPSKRSDKIRESLRIEGFAGIRELEIELSRINLLIGPQASGKSVAARLLYFFKSLHQQAQRAFLESNGASPSLHQLIAKQWGSYFPEPVDHGSPFQITYRRGDVHLRISWSSRLEIDGGEHFEEAFRQIRERLPKYQEKIAAGSFREFQMPLMIGNMLRQYTGLSREQLFIPAGRSFFSALEGNIFSFMSGAANMDPILREFGERYQAFKTRLRRTPSSEQDRNTLSAPVTEDTSDVLIKLFGTGSERILGGFFSSMDHQDFIHHSDGRKLRIGFTSSGQQEAAPLVVILAHLAFQQGSFSSSLYIEEPEAHLFPDAQHEMIKLTALTFNARRQFWGGEPDTLHELFITTHSPYILASFNNLLQAGRLYSVADTDGERERLREIVPEQYAIEPGEIAAYALADGTARSNLDPETGLIQAEEIDSVSDRLAGEFDRLLDLEFGD